MNSNTPTTTLDWKQADDDVHVATRDGEFAGFVEFDGSAHRAHDNRGSEVGAFPTLADARRALETPRKAARPPFRLSRRALRRARA